MLNDDVKIEDICPQNNSAEINFIMDNLTYTLVFTLYLGITHVFTDLPTGRKQKSRRESPINLTAHGVAALAHLSVGRYPLSWLGYPPHPSEGECTLCPGQDRGTPVSGITWNSTSDRTMGYSSARSGTGLWTRPVKELDWYLPTKDLGPETEGTTVN